MVHQACCQQLSDFVEKCKAMGASAVFRTSKESIEAFASRDRQTDVQRCYRKPSTALERYRVRDGDLFSATGARRGRGHQCRSHKKLRRSCLTSHHRSILRKSIRGLNHDINAPAMTIFRLLTERRFTLCGRWISTLSSVTVCLRPINS